MTQSTDYNRSAILCCSPKQRDFTSARLQFYCLLYLLWGPTHTSCRRYAESNLCPSCLILDSDFAGLANVEKGIDIHRKKGGGIVRHA